MFSILFIVKITFSYKKYIGNIKFHFLLPHWNFSSIFKELFEKTLKFPGRKSHSLGNIYWIARDFRGISRNTRDFAECADNTQLRGFCGFGAIAKVHDKWLKQYLLRKQIHFIPYFFQNLSSNEKIWNLNSFKFGVTIHEKWPFSRFFL